MSYCYDAVHYQRCQHNALKHLPKKFMEEIKTISLSIEEIQKIIPHRYPFLFIDRVTKFVDREIIEGVKNVSMNEFYFQGHFPGRPVMPAVIIIEALAQLGVIFAKLSTGGADPDKLMVFSGVEEMRFRRPVVPGDVLTLRLVEYKNKLVHWRMRGIAMVGDEIAAEGLIKATQVD